MPSQQMAQHIKSPRLPVVQQAVLAEIEQPDYSAALPVLPDDVWLQILTRSQWQHEENDRLEFLGDALMYATLGRQLYEEIPLGTPALYSTLRAALHSNQTFSRLAEKLDILAVSDRVIKALTSRTFGEGTMASLKSRRQVKATADLFETIIAVYFHEKGFEALCGWVAPLYSRLIRAGKDAYLSHSHPAQTRCQPPPPKTSRSYLPMKAAKVVVNPSRSRAVKKVTLNIKTPPIVFHHVLPAKRQIPSKVSTPSPTSSSKPIKNPVIIDLTSRDDDSDMELGSDVEDEPSAPPLAFADIRPPPESVHSSAERLTKEEQEDRRDEDYLERMLLAGD